MLEGYYCVSQCSKSKHLESTSSVPTGSHFQVSAHSQWSPWDSLQLFYTFLWCFFVVVVLSMIISSPYIHLVSLNLFLRSATSPFVSHSIFVLFIIPAKTNH